MAKTIKDNKQIISGSRKGLGIFKTEKEKTTVGGVAKPYKYTRESIDTSGYSKGKSSYELKTQKGEGDKTGFTIKSNTSKQISKADVDSFIKNKK